MYRMSTTAMIIIGFAIFAVVMLGVYPELVEGQSTK